MSRRHRSLHRAFRMPKLILAYRACLSAHYWSFIMICSSQCCRHANGSCRKRPTDMLQVCARLQTDGGSSSTGRCAMPLIDDLLGIAIAGLAKRKRDRLILKGAIWSQAIYVKGAGLLNARGTNEFAFADRTESARPLTCGHQYAAHQKSISNTTCALCYCYQFKKDTNRIFKGDLSPVKGRTPDRAAQKTVELAHNRRLCLVKT
jgi:hypothetical protein